MVRIGVFGGRLNSAEDKADTALQGVAMAIALSGSHLPRADEKFRMSFNMGYYENDTALLASGAAQVSDEVYLTGGSVLALVKAQWVDASASASAGNLRACLLRGGHAINPAR